MSVAIAPNRPRVVVPADFEPEVIEISDEEAAAEVHRINAQATGAQLFRMGASIDTCTNDWQRQGYRKEECYAKNAWRYQGDAETDGYLVRMGASQFELDYIHERVSGRR